MIKELADPGSGKRQVNMDLLRVLACLMVIAHHTAGLVYGSFGTGSQWLFSSLIEAAVWSDVPIFFMMSGSMFLNREKPVPPSRFIGKNTVKLFAVYLAWAVFYELDAGDYLHRLASWWRSPGEYYIILQQALSQSKYHLWFMPAMISVYLLVPVFYHAVNSEGGREQKILEYMIVLFFCLIILPQTVISAFSLSADNLLAQVSSKLYYVIGYSSGYFLLGAYLARKDFRKYRRLHILLAYIAVTLLHCGVSSWHAFKTGGGLRYMFELSNIFVFFEACLLFILFQNMAEIKFPAWIEGPLRQVVDCTLGIYMLHIFIMERIERRTGGLLLSNFHAVVSIPVTVAVIFGISLAVVWILKRIPFVRSWIV